MLCANLYRFYHQCSVEQDSVINATKDWRQESATIYWRRPFLESATRTLYLKRSMAYRRGVTTTTGIIRSTTHSHTHQLHYGAMLRSIASYQSIVKASTTRGRCQTTHDAVWTHPAHWQMDLFPTPRGVHVGLCEALYTTVNRPSTTTSTFRFISDHNNSTSLLQSPPPH